MAKPSLKTAHDYEYGSALIPPDALLGLGWEDDDGLRLVSKDDREPIKGKRLAFISETSFVGLSAGAMHFYAAIKVRSPSGFDPKSGSVRSGYLGKKAPSLGDDYGIEETIISKT